MLPVLHLEYPFFSNEYELNLPSFLIEDLENDDYGKDYLFKLEKEIALRFYK